MNCLVTGGAGFIGSHLADALCARGDRVTILDDLSTGAIQNVQHLLDDGRAELVEGSVLDEALVDELFSSAETCFHLASAVGVELVVDNPLESMLSNMRGTRTVTAAAARTQTRLLFTSTSEVYGKGNGRPLTEDADRIYGAPTRSRWGYAAAKAMGEMLSYAYVEERGADIVVVRLFNTVGPRQTGQYGMVLPRFVSQALAGEPLSVYGDGTQSRCFTHVLDSIDGIVGVASESGATGGVYNIGALEEVTIEGLANRVIERAGSASTIRLVPFEDAYGPGFEELGGRRPDTAAIERLTGWRAQRSLDEVIDDVVESQRAARGAVELA